MCKDDMHFYEAFHIKKKKNSTPLYEKTFQKVDIEGTYLNIMKAVYNKPTENIILSGEKLKIFPLRSGIRQGCPFSPLFNIVLKVLVREMREEKEVNRI